MLTVSIEIVKICFNLIGFAVMSRVDLKKEEDKDDLMSLCMHSTVGLGEGLLFRRQTGRTVDGHYF